MIIQPFYYVGLFLYGPPYLATTINQEGDVTFTSCKGHFTHEAESP
jgi:hypothetical protein